MQEDLERWQEASRTLQQELDLCVSRGSTIFEHRSTTSSETAGLRPKSARVPNKFIRPPAVVHHPLCSPRTRVVAHVLAARSAGTKEGPDSPLSVSQPLAALIGPSTSRPVTAATASCTSRPATARQTNISSAASGATSPRTPRALLGSTCGSLKQSSTSTSWSAEWKESTARRNQRMAKLYEITAGVQDQLNMDAAGQLDGLRDLAEERRRDLRGLEEELTRLQHEHLAAESSLGAALDGQLSELQQRIEMADASLDDAEHTGRVYSHLAARLTGCRPHLVRKLAFMRSSLVETAERLATQDAAQEVACRAEGRMLTRLEAEKERLKAQQQEHSLRREEMKETLSRSGTARRAAALHLLGPSTNRISGSQLRMLGGLLEEEHAAQTAELLELRADASARAEVNFQRESNSIDALRAPATVGVALTQSLRSPARPGHQLGRREAWEKVAAVCGADSVKGVLEYWEDYAETRETLLASEEDRTSKIAELHEQNRRLTDEVPPSPSQLDCISLTHTAIAIEQ